MKNNDDNAFASEAKIHRFVPLLMELNNETRMAELKGHKPNEMRQLQKV